DVVDLLPVLTTEGHVAVGADDQRGGHAVGPPLPELAACEVDRVVGAGELERNPRPWVAEVGFGVGEASRGGVDRVGEADRRVSAVASSCAEAERLSPALVGAGVELGW